jgi:hypothetical protein
MPCVEFEPTIIAFERETVHALDRAATAIGLQATIAHRIEHGHLYVYHQKIGVSKVIFFEYLTLLSITRMCRVQLKGAEKLLIHVIVTKIRGNIHANICPETFNLRVTAERVYL